MYKRKEKEKKTGIVGRETFPKIDLEVQYTRGGEKRTEKRTRVFTVEHEYRCTHEGIVVYMFFFFFFFLEPETVTRLL